MYFMVRLFLCPIEYANKPYAKAGEDPQPEAFLCINL